MTAPRPIRVLQPFTRIRPTTNPYIAMLHESLQSTPGVEPVLFSYRTAFLGGYDVVHLHWPETILEGRTRARRLARNLIAHAFLWRLRLLRVPIVRTVHNLELPSELNRLETAYLKGVAKSTTIRIHLSETTTHQHLSSGPVVVIPHGHYREWFARYPRNEAEPGRLGFVGLIRRYKNVTGLLKAFREARHSDPTLSLQVSGRPSSPELEAEIRSASGGVGVQLDLRFLDDADLVDAVTSCELLALPYHHMHNSGVVLTALSLDRPVLVPDNSATRAVRDEVGPGWVVTFDGEFDGDTIREALREVRQTRSTPSPDLTAREWVDAGTAHRRAYVAAIRAR